MPRPASGPVEMSSGALGWVVDAMRAERLAVNQEMERQHSALLNELAARFPEAVGAEPTFGFAALEEASELLKRAGPGENVELAAVLPTVMEPLAQRPQERKMSAGMVNAMSGGSNGKPNALPPVQTATEPPNWGSQGSMRSSPISPSGRTKRKQSIRQGGPGSDNDQQEGVLQILNTAVNNEWFEGLFAVLIMLNTTMIALEAQYLGIESGHILGYPGSENTAAQAWPWAATLFGILELFFGIIFTVEVLLKLSAMRQEYFASRWNIFDAFIVLAWIFSLIMPMVSMNPNVLRIVRLLRLLRMIRIFKHFQFFQSLYLMVSALQGSAHVVACMTVVLFFIMNIAALAMVYMLDGYYTDPSVADESKNTVYEYFGTFSRGVLSMFELTLGNWTPITRTLHEDVSELFGPAILVYRILVGEAIVKVITGVFLFETFKVAQGDDETMIMERQRQIDKHVKKMKILFEEADDSGDGFLSSDEFCAVCNDTRVKAWLSAMDIEVRDAKVMFHMIDDGDDRLSAAELVAGFAKLKGPARSIDLLTLMDEWRREVKFASGMTCSVSPGGGGGGGGAPDLNVLDLAAATSHELQERLGDVLSRVELNTNVLRRQAEALEAVGRSRGPGAPATGVDRDTQTDITSKRSISRGQIPSNNLGLLAGPLSPLAGDSGDGMLSPTMSRIGRSP